MFKLSAKEVSRLKKAGKVKKENKKAIVEPVKGRQKKEDYLGSPIIIHVDIEPQPKERARTFINDQAIVSAYLQSSGDVKRFMAVMKSNTMMKSLTPEATRNFEKTVGLVASNVMAKAGQKRFSCPVKMDIVIRIKGDENEHPTGHHDGDLDNHEKAIKDAINGIVYDDDRLVVAKTGIKVCSEKAGISMRITPIDSHSLSYFSNNF